MTTNTNGRIDTICVWGGNTGHARIRKYLFVARVLNSGSTLEESFKKHTGLQFQALLLQTGKN